MNVRQAYQTLELDYGASLDDIDRAHRNLIRVWHPDRFLKSPDLHAFAEEKTKRLNEARDLLRKAWESDRVANDAEPAGNSDEPSDGYEDHQVIYCGNDPRLKPVSSRSKGKPAAVAITKFGIVLATYQNGEIDEVIPYPRESIRSVITPNAVFLRAADDPCPGRRIEFSATEVDLVADDPEGIVKGLIASIRFRNDYFAKLFSKRVVAAIGLYKPPPQTAMPDQSVNADSVYVGILCSLAAIIMFVLGFIVLVASQQGGSPKDISQHIKFDEHRHHSGVGTTSTTLLFVNQDMPGELADNLSSCEITLTIRYYDGSEEKILNPWANWNRNETKSVPILSRAAKKIELTGRGVNEKGEIVILDIEPR